jgi:hypothetical protein
MVKKAIAKKRPAKKQRTKKLSKQVTKLPVAESF